ncbi:polysaccharide-degrading enzyme [Paenibacillus rhizovicinus]|uniref:Polysaccharide-degrading enzyme n=1 Tax=Paenibacillus rhizovicinus TaxID=2704463 RepID=A0A6C0PCK9_9BACL|nr:choice-of-anchor Q domain-containing protein [Paenibacillus rhizovicinus]QHW34782.1 polysaccharide-degrading enzyme [Paenibacillus rhizovicinus]
MRKVWYSLVALALVMGLFTFAPQTDKAYAASLYEVGPGKTYANIGDVPWESLNAGDQVKIYWRSTPYKEKFVISRQGTAAAPITITGVPNASGQRPVIDGNGATTRAALDFWNDNRSVIKIGGARFAGSASDPSTGNLPKYITIENLEVRGARSSYTYTNNAGATVSYLTNASPVFVEYGENLTFRNNVITDGGNGLFVASSDDGASRNILVEGNYIYGNGNSGSVYEHNVYTAAIGITFQYNHLGELCSGSSGNNLKDRSAGTVVRFNWIEGGNRQLDLVEGDDTTLISGDPSYHKTFVYGNVLIKPDDARNPQFVHYGGDNGTKKLYRKGTLYLYNNTFISNRSNSATILRLSSSGESADVRNNVFYKSAAASGLSIIDQTGTANLYNNWISTGYTNIASGSGGTVTHSGTITGTAPGFANLTTLDLRPATGSALINAGTSLPAAASAYPVNMEYVKDQSSVARAVHSTIDIGAFEN